MNGLEETCFGSRIVAASDLGSRGAAMGLPRELLPYEMSSRPKLDSTVSCSGQAAASEGELNSMGSWTASSWR